MTDGKKEGLLLGQDRGRPRSVEVDDLPFAVPAVPDAGLLRLGGAGDATGVQVLCDADIGDAGRLVTHQVDVGVQNSGVHGLAVPGPHCRWAWEQAELMNLGGFPLDFLHFPNFQPPSLQRPLCLPHFQRSSVCDRAQLPGRQGRASR